MNPVGRVRPCCGQPAVLAGRTDSSGGPAGGSRLRTGREGRLAAAGLGPEDNRGPDPCRQPRRPESRTRTSRWLPFRPAWPRVRRPGPYRCHNPARTPNRYLAPHRRVAGPPPGVGRSAAGRALPAARAPPAIRRRARCRCRRRTAGHALRPVAAAAAAMRPARRAPTGGRADDCPAGRGRRRICACGERIAPQNQVRLVTFFFAATYFRALPAAGHESPGGPSGPATGRMAGHVPSNIGGLRWPPGPGTGVAGPELLQVTRRRLRAQLAARFDRCR